MGLFEKLGISVTARSSKTPEPVPAPEDPQAILAPVSGHVIELESVGDPAFSQGMLGRGLGIKAKEDVAYAPVTGTVVADVKTKHALLIKSQSGAEVLLHVGIDSVTLRGAGFQPFVRKGDEVVAGTPVMRFDRTLMAERGLDDTVVVTVTNPEAFSSVESVCSGGEVSAGSVVLRCER